MEGRDKKMWSHTKCPKISKKFIWLSSKYEIYECKECGTKISWTWVAFMAQFLGMMSAFVITDFAIKPYFKTSFAQTIILTFLTFAITLIFLLTVFPYQMAYKKMKLTIEFNNNGFIRLNRKSIQTEVLQCSDDLLPPVKRC